MWWFAYRAWGLFLVVVTAFANLYFVMGIPIVGLWGPLTLGATASLACAATAVACRMEQGSWYWGADPGTRALAVVCGALGAAAAPLAACLGALFALESAGTLHGITASPFLIVWFIAVFALIAVGAYSPVLVITGLLLPGRRDRALAATAILALIVAAVYLPHETVFVLPGKSVRSEDVCLMNRARLRLVIVRPDAPPPPSRLDGAYLGRLVEKGLIHDLQLDPGVAAGDAYFFVRHTGLLWCPRHPPARESPGLW